LLLANFIVVSVYNIKSIVINNFRKQRSFEKSREQRLPVSPENRDV
jgi:hypothetical protein